MTSWAYYLYETFCLHTLIASLSYVRIILQAVDKKFLSRVGEEVHSNDESKVGESLEIFK